jgi:hypothetical protein
MQQVVDALGTKTFKDGEYVIRQVGCRQPLQTVRSCRNTASRCGTGRTAERVR